MLPNPNRDPTCAGESRVGIGVAPSIPLNLLGPPHRDGTRHPLMVRTAMPETAIYEDCDPGSDKHDVCRAAETRYHVSMKPVAKPEHP
jgi:hypothetical protein